MTPRITRRRAFIQAQELVNEAHALCMELWLIHCHGLTDSRRKQAADLLTPALQRYYRRQYKLYRTAYPQESK